MKISIRAGVFETNSSSVHSMTIIDDADWLRWMAGEVYYDSVKNKFVEKAEADSEYNNEEDRIDYGVHTYKDYLDCSVDYEHYHEKHTSPSGDLVHIIGYHGYNG